MDGWNTGVLLGRPIFRCRVDFGSLKLSCIYEVRYFLEWKKSHEENAAFDILRVVDWTFPQGKGVHYWEIPWIPPSKAWQLQQSGRSTCQIVDTWLVIVCLLSTRDGTDGTIIRHRIHQSGMFTCMNAWFCMVNIQIKCTRHIHPSWVLVTSRFVETFGRWLRDRNVISESKTIEPTWIWQDRSKSRNPRKVNQSF